MYKLGFYVPLTHVDGVKNALFQAGAGKIGNYQCCAWQVLGRGQFLPMDQARPFIGEKATLEAVEEYRVEMVVEDSLIRPVVLALKSAHPYDEPAYDVVKLCDWDSLPE